MLLTKQFRSDQYAMALESWSWIGGVSLQTPILASLFGAIFLRGPDGYWWLDPVSGSHQLVAESRVALQAVLETESGQDELLLGALAMAAADRGVSLGADQVYVFSHPPALGRGFEVERIEAMDFVVAVNLAGQLHEQIRDLPPGTRISGVKITEDR